MECPDFEQLTGGNNETISKDPITILKAVTDNAYINYCMIVFYKKTAIIIN